MASGLGSSSGGGVEGWGVGCVLKAIPTQQFPYGVLLRYEGKGGVKEDPKGWDPHLLPSQISVGHGT